MQFTLFPILAFVLSFLSLFSCTLALPTPQVQPGSLMGRTYSQRAVDVNSVDADTQLIAPPQTRTLDRAARFQRRLALANGGGGSAQEEAMRDVREYFQKRGAGYV